MSFESTGLDFEVDFTDLETFGETTTVKPPKKTKSEKEQSTSVKSEKTFGSPPIKRTTGSSGPIDSKQTNGSLQEEVNSSSTGIEDSIKEETTQSVFSEASTPPSPAVPKAKRLKPNSTQESEEEATSMGDSEDERLVIDDPVSPAEPPATQPKPETPPSSQDAPVIPSSEPIPDTPRSPSPKTAIGPTRGARRAKVPGDQLGQILRMQTAMLKPAKDPDKCSTPTPEPLSPPRSTGASGHAQFAHPISLVKPCVSSYLESNQNRDGVTYTVAHTEPASGVNLATTEQKSWCHHYYHCTDLRCDVLTVDRSCVGMCYITCLPL